MSEGGRRLSQNSNVMLSHFFSPAKNVPRKSLNAEILISGKQKMAQSKCKAIFF